MLLDARILSPPSTVSPRGVALILGVLLASAFTMPFQTPVPRSALGNNATVPCSEVDPEGIDDPAVLGERPAAFPAFHVIHVIRDHWGQKSVDRPIPIEGIKVLASAAPPVLWRLVELANGPSFESGDLARTRRIDNHACATAGEGVVAFHACFERLKQTGSRPAPAAFPPAWNAYPLQLRELLWQFRYGQ